MADMQSFTFSAHYADPAFDEIFKAAMSEDPCVVISLFGQEMPSKILRVTRKNDVIEAEFEPINVSHEYERHQIMAVLDDA